MITLRNKALLKSLSQTSPIFKQTCLRVPRPASLLNSNESLSNIEIIKTRQNFSKTYKLENPSAGEAKVMYKFFVMFLQFYKEGIKNVYSNYKTVSALKNDFKIQNKDIVPGVKNQHQQIKYKNTKQLVKFLSNAVRNYQNELKATQDLTKFLDNPHSIELTRAQFQQILRTSKDIYKLPAFAVLFLLLEEFTVFLCYIFPDLTPSTCLIPQLTPRFYKGASQAQKRLYTLTRKIPAEEMVTKSAYSMSKAQLVALVETLQLKSRYIPVSFYTEERLKDLLQAKYQEICVDNYLILRDGGVWNLSKLELIDTCLQRGLINLESFINLSKSSEENFIDLVNTNELKLKLFKHINNAYADGANVGLLAIRDTEEGLMKKQGDQLMKEIIQTV